MWPTIKIPNPFNALNPTTYINDAFNWINGKIHDLFTGLATTFQNVLTNPPQFHAASWQDYLDGSSIALANMLIFAVATCLFVIIMFRHQRLKSLPHLAITVVGLAIADQSFFTLCDWLSSTGHTLSVAAQFYHPTTNGSGGSSVSGSLLVVPTFANVIGSIIGLSWLAFFGVILVAIVVFTYILIGEVVRFLILPVFVLRPIGDRSQKFFDWLVSLGLVAMVFGLATAVFCLELGKMATDNLPAGTTSFGSTFYLTAALGLAIFMQVILVLATHSVWVNARTGRLFSTIRGRVESFTRRNRRAEAQSVHAAHARTMQPVPVTLAKPSPGKRVKQAIRQEAVRQGVTRVAGAKVAASAHPLIGATVVVGSAAAQKYMRSRAQRAA